MSQRICETCRHFVKAEGEMNGGTHGECHEDSPKLTHLLLPVQTPANILTAGQSQQGLQIRGFSGWPSVSGGLSCGKWKSHFERELQ